jgi:hypothetical protein
MVAIVGQTAPALALGPWVQGGGLNLDGLRGQVVLIEVFQVNCPGCFLYSLPQAIDLYARYVQSGLQVLGVATAFEDFDKNTLYNLQRLLQNGTLVGESLRALSAQGLARDGRWLCSIPFQVAMDSLVENRQVVDDIAVVDYIHQHVPGFDAGSADDQQHIMRRVKRYLQRLEYRAETFELYGLQGTPSHIVVDRQGILRAKHFGAFPHLESTIQKLLSETAEL